MRRALSSLLPLFLAATAFANITGRTVDRDGAVIAGARVRAFERETFEARRARVAAGSDRKPLASATTAAEGDFSIEAKGHRVVEIVIDAPSRHPSTIEAIDGEDLGSVLLAPARIRAGRVIADGKPVSGALVTSGDVSVRTKADGTFEIVPAEDSLVVTHPDYAQSVGSTVTAGDIVLTPGMTVSGRVLGQDGKTPVAHASLMIDGSRRAESREDGTFTIARVPQGWATIVALASGLSAQARHGASNEITLRLGPAAAVTGTLRTSSGGPVADAILMLSSPAAFSALSAITDAKGNFSLVGVPSGTYYLRLRDPEFTVAEPIMFDAGSRPVVRNLTALATARVSGIVVDPEQKPLPVALVGSAGLNTRGRMTDAAGHFTIRIRSDQPDSLVVQHARYAANVVGPFKVAAGQMKSDVKIVMTPGFPFELRAVDRSGKPVSGEPVMMTRGEDETGMGPRTRILCSDLDLIACAMTSPSGTFTTRLTEGAYDINVGGGLFVMRRIRRQAINARSTPLTLELDRGVSITGRVVYTDGSPAAAGKFYVMARDLFAGARITEGGAFEIRNVPAGLVSLSAVYADNGFTKTGDAMEVKAPATNVVLRVPKPARLEGVVSARDTHDPVKEFDLAIIRLPGPMPQAQHFTAEDGRFAVEDVVPVPGDVEIKAPGFATATIAKVAFEEGKPATLNVQLDRGGVIRGRITSGGKPVAGAAIEVNDPRRRPFRAPNIADEDGQYVIDGLAAGEYSLAFSARSFAGTQKSVQVEAGKEARLDVDLTAGRTLRGRVNDAAGQPVAGARIFASVPGTRGPSPVQSDTDGTFVLDGLSDGKLSVTASRNGYVSATQSDIDPSAGQVITLTLQRGGTVTGRVTGLSETDLYNVRVSASSRSGMASAFTDPAGNFSLTGLPDGRVTVRAVLQGRDMRQSGVKTIEVTNGSAPSVELDFAGLVKVSGHVTRAGSPAAGLRVGFTPASGGTSAVSEMTTTDGAYEASVPGPGDYNVFITSGSDMIPQKRVTVTGDMSYDVDLGGSTLHVRVTDADTNAPLSGAQLVLSAVVQPPAPSAGTGRGGVVGGVTRPRSGLTDSDGQYLFDSVSDGSYRLVVQKEQYSAETQTLSVNGNGDATVALRGAQKLDLNVFDAIDQRPVDAMVTIFDQSKKQVPTAPPMRDGSGAMHVWVKAGQYNVRVWAPGYLPSSQQASVPGQTLQVSLQPGAKLIVTPVAGAVRVRLVIPAAARPVATVSMPPGVFDGLQPGTYRLEALDAAGLVLKQQMVVIAAGQTTTITMP